MGGNRKEIDIAERKIIIDLWKRGKSLRLIAETVNRRHSSIQKVIMNYKSTGLLTSKPRSGRPSALSIRESRFIIRSVKINPRLSASQIAKSVAERFQKNVSLTTIRRELKKHNYHGRVARKKPFISRVNRAKRMAFAKEHLNKTLDFWKKVIYSDESKFCIFGIKGRKYVWRKPCTELKKENLFPTVKHGGGGRRYGLGVHGKQWGW